MRIYGTLLLPALSSPWFVIFQSLKANLETLNPLFNFFLISSMLLLVVLLELQSLSFDFFHLLHDLHFLIDGSSLEPSVSDKLFILLPLFELFDLGKLNRTCEGRMSLICLVNSKRLQGYFCVAWNKVPTSLVEPYLWLVLNFSFFRYFMLFMLILVSHKAILLIVLMKAIQ
jgi:hypothetical protein